jgi:hypothetical protein
MKEDVEMGFCSVAAFMIDLSPASIHKEFVGRVVDIAPGFFVG